MNYATFTINSNTIQFENSYLGVETILLNNDVVSKKFSFSGAKHKIVVDSKILTLESKYEQFTNRMIVLKLKENYNLIESKTVPVHFKQRLYFAVIGVAIGFGLVRLVTYLF